MLSHERKALIADGMYDEGLGPRPWEGNAGFLEHVQDAIRIAVTARTQEIIAYLGERREIVASQPSRYELSAVDALSDAAANIGWKFLPAREADHAKP